MRTFNIPVPTYDSWYDDLHTLCKYKNQGTSIYIKTDMGCESIACKDCIFSSHDVAETKRFMQALSTALRKVNDESS